MQKLSPHLSLKMNKILRGTGNACGMTYGNSSRMAAQLVSFCPSFWTKVAHLHLHSIFHMSPHFNCSSSTQMTLTTSSVPRVKGVVLPIPAAVRKKVTFESNTTLTERNCISVNCHNPFKTPSFQPLIWAFSKVCLGYDTITHCCVLFK